MLCSLIPDLFFFPFFFLSVPDLLCDPTDVIWRYRTPFEAITGGTVFIRRSLSCGIPGITSAARYLVHARFHFIVTLVISQQM